MINPRYTSIEQTSSSRVRRYGIDNHPEGSINLSERIKRAEHGSLARRPWESIFFYLNTYMHYQYYTRKLFWTQWNWVRKILKSSMVKKIIKLSNIWQKKALAIISH